MAWKEPTLSTIAALMCRVDELVAGGHALEAIEILTEANRRQRDATIERTLVRLRHDAWSETARNGSASDWNPSEPDLFPDEPAIPEVDVGELDAVRIRSAIQHRGALIVRGLFSPGRCSRLRTGIDCSWDAMARYRQTKKLDPAWFDPIDTSAYGLTMASRAWVIRSGTSYVPDSPRLLFDLLEAFDAAHVKQIVGEYFGERPALSLIKVAQRRLAPDATGGWHQDAAVYGLDARTLNFWIPVSRCGDVAPGLAMWPKRLDYLVDTVGIEGVAEFTADEAHVARLTAELPAVRPIFDEGDAVIFDQMLLHQTAASLAFTEQRYGFECWFFAPSTYPDPNRFIPLVY